MIELARLESPVSKTASQIEQCAFDFLRTRIEQQLPADLQAEPSP